MTKAIVPTDYATETILRLVDTHDEQHLLSLGDPVAERSLIGVLLRDAAVFPILTITAKDFTDQFCAFTFYCIQNLLLIDSPPITEQEDGREQLDLNRVQEQMATQPQFANTDTQTIYTHLAQCIGLGSGIADPLSLNKTIQDRARRIRSATAYSYSYRKLTDKSIPVDDALSLAGEATDRAQVYQSYKDSSIKSVYKRMREGQGKLTYIKSGYDALDDFIVGFPTGQISVYGAETGFGKTTWLANIVTTMSHTKKASGDAPFIIVFVKEQTDTEIVQKMTQTVTGVPVEAYAGSGLNADQSQRVDEAEPFITKPIIHVIDDCPITPFHMLRRVRLLERQHGRIADAVWVDGLYLAEMDDPQQRSQFEQQYHIIMRMQGLISGSDTAWIWTAQLKKNTYQTLEIEARPPTFTDFEGWGKTYQYVHNLYAMTFSALRPNEMRWYSIKQRSRSQNFYGQFVTFYRDSAYNRFVQQTPNDDTEYTYDEPPF